MKLKFEKKTEKVNNGKKGISYSVYQNGHKVVLDSILFDLKIDNYWPHMPVKFNPCNCSGGLSVQEIFQNAEKLGMTSANYFAEMIKDIRAQSFCEIVMSECEII